MTAVRIFQSYFDARSKGYVDPVAQGVDIGFNLNHPLYEYNIFKTLLANGTMNPDSGPCGLISWKFKTKTLIDVGLFADFCANSFAQGADVAFINPMIGAEALYANVWEQGEHVGHKGMQEIMEALFSAEEKAKLALMPKSVFAFCNYFVANARFWSRYIAFCEEILRRCEALKTTNPAVHAILHASAHYHRNLAVDFKPFILERLFSTFLLLNPDIVRANVDYHPIVYTSKFGAETGGFLRQLSEAKNHGILAHNQDSLLQWDRARHPILDVPSSVTKIWVLDDPDPK